MIRALTIALLLLAAATPARAWLVQGTGSTPPAVQSTVGLLILNNILILSLPPQKAANKGGYPLGVP